MIPVKFLKSIEKNAIFASFFKPKVLFEVTKEKFYPKPKTNSFVIDLIRLPDQIKTKNFGRFFKPIYLPKRKTTC
ncbi:MAG: hypothetical protein KatS3mg090_0114 [Patescibacteria group bacterium]|nr:MAG: hypothetical protein KatS3mg090_0114 [Patescibacteria group bacterium]